MHKRPSAGWPSPRFEDDDDEHAAQTTTAPIAQHPNPKWANPQRYSVSSIKELKE